MDQTRKPSTKSAALLALCGLGVVACRGATDARSGSFAATTPSILLVTLDTTRYDAIGPEARGIETPGFSALAARGRLFRQAYTTAPETLPAHVSMMSGLYPAGHGIHENARPVPREVPLVAERLRDGGYDTAAFVSSFVLARRFGLDRGFSVYDDALPDPGTERSARETTDRALAFLGARDAGRPAFVWVHYFDPHAPYAPPEAYRERFAESPYLGEVAAMDEQLGRLVDAFEASAPGEAAILVVGDHGEGLGDHGELQHGNLIYQPTMQVPLVLAGPGVRPAVVDVPVSTRRVFETILGWAGHASAGSLVTPPSGELVLGEGLRPFLAYGWQPQVMAVEGRTKTILAGRAEVYDVVADPREENDLAPRQPPSAAVLAALRDYPLPTPGRVPSAPLDAEARGRLASLGYVETGAAAPVRADAPRPADMTHLFPLLDEASALFVREEYARAAPLYERIRAEDPGNLDAALRLGTAYSALGRERQALAAFEAAAGLAPDSEDVRTYLALHYVRGPEWPKAAPLLERIVADSPGRLSALEGLAVVRQRQGRIDDAIALRERIYAMRAPTAGELVTLGQMAMSRERTDLAVRAFERAREQAGTAFAHDLELGVLYLAARRLDQARDALDRIGPDDGGYAMALFKRAQVSVLLDEPDRDRRIARAREHADATTRPLIEGERLFRR